MSDADKPRSRHTTVLLQTIAAVSGSKQVVATHQVRQVVDPEPEVLLWPLVINLLQPAASLLIVQLPLTTQLRYVTRMIARLIAVY